MTNPDKRPGTLPGYLPVAEAERLADVPIDPVRPLSIIEYADMLAADLERDEIVGFTPEQLRDIADMVVERSELFVGP